MLFSPQGEHFHRREHAFTRVPYFDPCTYIPYDVMHVELEGLLKNELAAMLYYFTRKRDWGFTLQALNERINSYAWPRTYRPPTFSAKVVEKGTTRRASARRAATFT